MKNRLTNKTLLACDLEVGDVFKFPEPHPRYDNVEVVKVDQT